MTGEGRELAAVADETVSALIRHAHPDQKPVLTRQREVLRGLELDSDDFSADEFLAGEVKRALGI